MSKKIYLIFVLIILSIYLYSDEKGDNSSDFNIYDYISISEEENLYDLTIDWYKIDIEYIKSLNFRNIFNTGHKYFDDKNIVKNTNILPFFPFVLAPVFDYSFNKGFDTGFIFILDNIKNFSISSGLSFCQNEYINFLFGFEYYGFLKNKRLSLMNNLYFYTSIPQYYSKYYYNSDINFLYNAFSSIWKTLRISFNELNTTGISYNIGIDYRVPVVELNFLTQLSINYRYDYGIIINDKESILDKNNFYIIVSENIIWNKTKQSKAVLVGNYLKTGVDFFIPTMIGDIASDFRFKFRLEDRFYYKFFKEFYIKLRGIFSINYNISDDYSGDPYVRGFAKEELTGFLALIGNAEIYIPLIHISLKDSVNQERFKKEPNFILYLTFFVDGGFTIENFSYILDNKWYRKDIKSIKNSLTGGSDLLTQFIGNNSYIFPALSVGSGLKVYPYFLNFIFRIDFAMNILKAIIYQKPEESFQIVFSLSDSF